VHGSLKRWPPLSSAEAPRKYGLASAVERCTGDRGCGCPRSAVPGRLVCRSQPNRRRSTVEPARAGNRARLGPGLRARRLVEHLHQRLRAPASSSYGSEKVRRSRWPARRCTTNENHKRLAKRLQCQCLCSKLIRICTSQTSIENIILNCSASDSPRTRECLASPYACKDTLQVAT